MKNIIRAIGTGIDEDFDITKCNYGKIIISTDADVDGLHIQLLLIVFIYRHMRPLIEHGMVYIAQSPLFKITHKNNNEYIYYQRDLEPAKKKYGNAPIKIQRYKGLGELQGDELFKTTMNPESRNLLKLVMEDALEVDRLLSTTMGKNTELKRNFLDEMWNVETDCD